MLRQRSAWDTVSRPIWIPRTRRNPARKHLKETPARVGLNFAGQGERQQGDHLLLGLGDGLETASSAWLSKGLARFRKCFCRR
jgi:hypothetical protein